MVAALLDLQELAGPVGVRRGGGLDEVADRHDVAGRVAVARPSRGLELLAIADDARHAGQRAPARGIDLHGAAGGDDLRVGPFARQTADRGGGILLRFPRHGAGVHHDGARIAGQQRFDRGTLGGVEPAAEIDHVHGMGLMRAATRR